MKGRSLQLCALYLCGAAACSLGDEPDHCGDGEGGYVCMVAGTGELGFNRDGLPPEQSDLYLVSQARRGPNELLYLMDFNNHRLRVVDQEGVMQTIAGNGFHGPGYPGALAVDSPLENPIDFDFLPDGSPIFVNYHDPRIMVLTSEGKLRVVAGSFEPGEIGNEGDGGPALFARFIQLDGIAVAEDGAIYVSDSLANRIRVVRNGIVETFAGTGAAAYSGDGGSALEAALSWPTALSFGPEGSLYVADSGNHVIRRISPDGIIETIAGNGQQGDQGDQGLATEASLNRPSGVAIDNTGTLYIADRNNFKIRSVSPEGIIDTLAGTGNEGLAGDGDLALAADFSFVARITLDGDSLLVADQGNSCVRRILLQSANSNLQSRE